MKIFMSLFMLPATFAVGIVVIGGIFVFCDAEGLRPVPNEYGFWSNLYFSALYFAISVTLAASAVNCVYSTALTIFGLIVHARIRAMLTLVYALISGLVTFYLLQLPI